MIEIIDIKKEQDYTVNVLIFFAVSKISQIAKKILVRILTFATLDFHKMIT